MKSRRWLWMILALAAVLRCLWIGTRSINYDDAFSVFLSQRSLAEIVSGTAADTMPPLYYFLLHFWMLISGELWWLRLLSVMLSLGIVWGTWYWVSQLAGESAGLWAAAFTAVSPFQIYHAQDLRMYALLGLSQLGYFIFFTRILKADGTSGRWWNWAGLIGCGTAAMYSHNLAIFGLAAANVILLIKREWKLFWRLIAAQLVIGLLALPWLLMVPGQVEKIQRAFWTPRPGMTDIIQALLVFNVHLPLDGGWMIAGLGLSILVFILVMYEAWLARKKINGILALAGVFFILPGILFIVSYLIRPVFVPRGFILASLAYYGLIGAVVARRWRHGIGKLVAGAFLAAALLSLPFFYRFESFPRSPFREAAQALMAEHQAGDVIVHDNKLSYFPMRFFEPDLAQKFIADEAGSHNDTFAPASQVAMDIFPEPDLATAAAGAESITFVTFSETIAEYAQMGIAEHPGLAWLQERYVLTGRELFGDLEVYHFETAGSLP